MPTNATRTVPARRRCGLLYSSLVAAAVVLGCTPVSESPLREPTRLGDPPRAQTGPQECASIIAEYVAELPGAADPVDTLLGVLRSRRFQSTLAALPSQARPDDDVQVIRIGRGAVLEFRAAGPTATRAHALCQTTLPAAVRAASAPLSEPLGGHIRDRMSALRAAMEQKQLALWDFRLRLGAGGLNPEKRLEVVDRRAVELEDAVIGARRRHAPATELSQLEALRNDAIKEALDSNMRATEWDRLKRDADVTQQQLDDVTRYLAEAEARRVLGQWEVLDDCGPCRSEWPR